MSSLWVERAVNALGGELGWDLLADDAAGEHGLPPGFRFHPTDEELVTFYLASKVFNGGHSGVDIVEVDLNRCEPWELPEIAKMGEREWYFFSLRDRKYPTGLRTNRATVAGYWKATGKDREVQASATGALVGMKKTLVFYKGRAPRGEKTRWVLHEYRLHGELCLRQACKEEWVICRIFHKGGGEKKISGFYHNPSCFLEPPSSSLQSSFSPVQEDQSLEHSIQSLLMTQTLIHHHPLLPETLENCPLFSLPGPSQPHHFQPLTNPNQEEYFTNWLEPNPQNPNPPCYELARSHLGPAKHGEGAPILDEPMMGPCFVVRSGPLVP